MPEMIDRKVAGQRLKDARVARKLSQEVAAKMIGVVRTELSELENGRRIPSWVRLVWIMETLELDPKILFPECFSKIEKKAKKTI